MLDEYALIPDIFKPDAYSDRALIDVCLPHLKEPLLQEALVRDLCDGQWSQFCLANTLTMHRFCKELLRKLALGNRLRSLPLQGDALPTTSEEWCKEALNTCAIEGLSGIITSHSTKQSVSATEVASIEKLTNSLWWQKRSPSSTVDRKTQEYLRLLKRVLLQARSLMFIDPNLDPSGSNYREFPQLLLPLVSRNPKPRIEIHRSFCKGDGAGRTLPTRNQWIESFSSLDSKLIDAGLTAEVFFWTDFHERYLISDVLGIMVPAGFDVTAKVGEWTTWGRLGREDKDKFQRMFDPASRPADLKWQFSIGAPVA
jgi:hypothetical protein